MTVSRTKNNIAGPFTAPYHIKFSQEFLIGEIYFRRKQFIKFILVLPKSLKKGDIA